MRQLFDADAIVTAAKGAVGIGATTGGFYVSIMPKIEAWLRFVSLIVGIAVGIATFVSIVRNQKQKAKNPMKKTKTLLLLLVITVLGVLLPALCFAQAPDAPSPIASSGVPMWQTVISLMVAVVVVARIIVKLTPTPKDDSILEKVVGFLKHVGLHVDSK